MKSWTCFSRTWAGNDKPWGRAFAYLVQLEEFIHFKSSVQFHICILNYNICTMVSVGTHPSSIPTRVHTSITWYSYLSYFHECARTFLGNLSSLCGHLNQVPKIVSMRLRVQDAGKSANPILHLSISVLGVAGGRRRYDPSPTGSLTL